MKKQTRYYVYRCEDGSYGRLAMFGYVKGEYGVYGYEPGEGWKFMPGLTKIEYDVTDYEAITEAEAKEIMAQKDRENR